MLTHVVINWRRVDWCRNNERDKEVDNNEVYRSRAELILAPLSDLYSELDSISVNISRLSSSSTS